MTNNGRTYVAMTKLKAKEKKPKPEVDCTFDNGGDPDLKCDDHDKKMPHTYKLKDEDGNDAVESMDEFCIHADADKCRHNGSKDKVVLKWRGEVPHPDIQAEVDAGAVLMSQSECLELLRTDAEWAAE